ncbi:hypothetical protein HDU84_006461 [Entophlyctis sp. JEL0112]|nr:hypothetical protein HDU84_006461 [Entophlyctis sp. JEL0112]
MKTSASRIIHNWTLVAILLGLFVATFLLLFPERTRSVSIIYVPEPSENTPTSNETSTAPTASDALSNGSPSSGQPERYRGHKVHRVDYDAICSHHFGADLNLRLSVPGGPPPPYTFLKDLWTVTPKHAQQVLDAETQKNPHPQLRVVGINYDKDNKAAPMPFNAYMCETTIFSAAVNGIPLELYGAGPFFKNYMGGKDGKVDRMMAVLCALDPREYVLMIDSWDTLFQRPFDELQFIYFHKMRTPNLVISAEAMCSPPFPENCNPEFLSKTGPSGIKYINSGTVAAKVDYFAEFVNTSLEAYSNGIIDDQNVYTKMVHKHHRERGYYIDHDMELAGSLQPPGQYSSYYFNNRSFLVIGDTRTVPALVHLNGGGKEVIIPEEGHLWYIKKGASKSIDGKVKDLIRDYVILVDGVKKTVREICPGYDWGKSVPGKPQEVPATPAHHDDPAGDSAGAAEAAAAEDFEENGDVADEEEEEVGN